MPEQTDRLAEIQDRIPALYKGPWSVSWADGDGENTPDRWVVSYPTDNPLAGLVAEVADYGAELADFIAHSRTDVPWLVAEVQTLRTRLATAERQLRDLDDAIEDAYAIPGEEGEYGIRVPGDDGFLILAPTGTRTDCETRMRRQGDPAAVLVQRPNATTAWTEATA